MSSLSSPLFLWTCFALGCLGLEILQGMPFVLIFGALSGAVTAGLVALGVLPTFFGQATFATVFALFLLLEGRRYLVAWAKRGGFGRPGSLGSPEGALGLALDAAEPGTRLRLELFGVPWGAKNVGTESVAKGSTCKVVAVDGLRLDVVGVEKI